MKIFEFVSISQYFLGLINPAANPNDTTGEQELQLLRERVAAQRARRIANSTQNH